MLAGAAAARRLTMIEFGHFISVIVKLARGAANDGDCDFEKPFSSCGYTQGRDDDLDWEQIDTSEKPSLDPWMPPGSAFMMVNSTGRFAGQKALLFTPQLKENDTHCVIFQYYVAGREGGRPGHLNVYIKENNSPMGLPVWNTSGPAGRSWIQVELAISTYWPNFYQTSSRAYLTPETAALQIVFEAVTSGQRGLLAIKDVVLQGHQCSKTRLCRKNTLIARSLASSCHPPNINIVRLSPGIEVEP
ncbi:receptor-type tyrosine- phosphatase mu-like protein [Labeo rohita]|uniref:Receptor-type tyrosine-phosphatase mu-like protein n=1 Tax=Labeo rohita TaxID=84645 RepID=A0A498MSD4_LABRO|nr:receptor-type tyrosine- phosphatase mu-like protein [Labeo rohita]